MFISKKEMKSVIYSYQMGEITEYDDDIVEDAILSATSEVQSYFTASNQKRFEDGRPRYDVKAIFTAKGKDRSPFVTRLVKTIAAWNICELSNVDIIYEHVKERYDRAMETLMKIAGMGDYKTTPLSPDLPTIDDGNNNPDNDRKPFRYGSRAKFNHE